MSPSTPGMLRGWRRFDTLGLRLFVLMWVVLVASHAAAYWLAVPARPPGDAGPSRLAQLPPLPSLPPGSLMAPDEAPLAAAPGAPPRGAPPQGTPPALPAQALWLDYAIRLLVIALGAALGARWLAAPMRRLAGAAEQLSHGLAPGQPLPTLDEQHGTREVRASAQVFNRMAQRLQAQFDARGLQMAAVSHDLRTPLTRLRMRLEGLDAPVAQAAIGDIHEMNALIDSSLAVLREQRDSAAPSVVDVVALAQAAVDDLAEQGHDVALLDIAANMPALRARAHPLALRRIVDNLLGNALRHGRQVRVSVGSDADGVVLRVDDDGPGIAPALIEQALQPWVQLGTGGGAHQGLGLAIARDLAERDGGLLTLANRAEGGLRARLWLPAA
jgi:signal transduction histidine kinase